MIGKILRILKFERVKKSVNGMSLFTCENKYIDDLVRIANKDINEINTEGKTPIFYSKTKSRMIRLIANGADVNFCSVKKGETPLFSEHNINSIKILLKSKANPNHVSNDDYTALGYHLRYHNINRTHYSNILSLIKATDEFNYEYFFDLFELKPSFILEVINYLITKRGELISYIPYPYNHDEVIYRNDLLHGYLEKKHYRRRFLNFSNEEKEVDNEIVRILIREEVKYLLGDENNECNEQYLRLNKSVKDLTQHKAIYFNIKALKEIAKDEDYEYLFKELFNENFLKGGVIDNLFLHEFVFIYKALNDFNLNSLTFFFKEIHPKILNRILELMRREEDDDCHPLLERFFGDIIAHIYDKNFNSYREHIPSKTRRMIFITEQLKYWVGYKDSNLQNLIHYTFTDYKLTNKLIELGVNPKDKSKLGEDSFEKLDPRSQEHYWNYMSEKEKNLIQSCLSKNQRESYKKDESPNRRKRL
ncbi:hypothetical protein ACVV7K_003822 [Cronobacter sakazakii]